MTAMPTPPIATRFFSEDLPFAGFPLAAAATGTSVSSDAVTPARLKVRGGFPVGKLRCFLVPDQEGSMRGVVRERRRLSFHDRARRAAMSGRDEAELATIKDASHRT